MQYDKKIDHFTSPQLFFVYIYTILKTYAYTLLELVILFQKFSFYSIKSKKH